MDWELSSISRLLTVGYLLIGVPIMFVYLKTTGGLAAKAIRLLTKQLINCHRRQFVGKDGSRLSQTTCGKVWKLFILFLKIFLILNNSIIDFFND